jgi:predicted peptidase
MSYKARLLYAGRSAVVAAVASLVLTFGVKAEQTEHTLKKNIEVQMDYLLYLPEDYKSPTPAASYPLVVFLHGGGASNLTKVSEQFLPSLIKQGKQFPFIMVSPRNPREEEFFPQEQVATVVEEIASTYKVDRDRIYLVGNSRGAFTAFQMIQNYPDTYAAVVAVSGGGIAHYLDRVRPWTPFWIFHGNNDETVKLSESVAMVQKLKDLGGSRDIRFTVYEGAGHSQTDDLAFSDPALYEWLLKQSRVPPKTVTPTAKSTDTVVKPAVVK